MAPRERAWTYRTTGGTWTLPVLFVAVAVVVIGAAAVGTFVPGVGQEGAPVNWPVGGAIVVGVAVGAVL